MRQAGWEGGFRGEWIHVYAWLSTLAVHLKLPHIVNQFYLHTKQSLKFKIYIYIYKKKKTSVATCIVVIVLFATMVSPVSAICSKIQRP